MKKVTVYSTDYCPYCVQAKRLLESKNIPYEEVNLSGDDRGRQAIQEKTGWMTVPIIMIEDELVGGFSELSALDSQGKLEGKLES